MHPLNACRGNAWCSLRKLKITDIIYRKPATNGFVDPGSPGTFSAIPRCYITSCIHLASLFNLYHHHHAFSSLAKRSFSPIGHPFQSRRVNRPRGACATGRAAGQGRSRYRPLGNKWRGQVQDTCCADKQPLTCQTQNVRLQSRPREKLSTRMASRMPRSWSELEVDPP